MRFTTEIIKDVVVEKVSLKRATMKESVEFRAILGSLLEKGHKKIVVDLIDCEFIDSTFLSVFVWALKEIRKVNGNIVLVGFQEAVQSLFDATGMNRVFTSYDNLETAISSI